MDVLLEYLRPFYPIAVEEVGESPFGRPFVLDDWVTDNRDWEFEIERLLEEIENVHKIPFSVTLVSNAYHASNYPQLEIEEHSDAYRRVMNSADQLTGTKRTQLPHDLRNTSGNLSVGHTLLVFVDGKLRWYESHWDDWKRRIIQFLDSLLDYGPDFFKTRLVPPRVVEEPPDAETEKELLSAGDSPVEGELLVKLVKSGLLGEGSPAAQRRVGRRHLFREGLHMKVERSALKRIDLVFEREDSVWVIEAKKALDWKAIGQVLGYAILYIEDWNPKEEVLKGVVYRHPDPTLEYCCEKLLIRTFPEKDLL